jgi:hypothetical protein
VEAQFFEFRQITQRKEVQKFVNGGGNENKGKEPHLLVKAYSIILNAL